MEVPALDRRRGGLATLVGYLVVLAVLFRDSSRGLVSAPAAASVAGLGLAVLAVVAILASLRAMWAYVRVDA